MSEINDERKTENCCSSVKHKATPRSEKSVKQLINRINRISGQLSGIKKMIEDNRYCGDILIQIAAVENALQSFGYTVLQDHMNTCMVEKIKSGDEDVINETMQLIKKLK